MEAKKQIIHQATERGLSITEGDGELTVRNGQKSILFDWNDHCTDFGIGLRFYLYNCDWLYDDSYIDDLNDIPDLIDWLF